MPLDWVTVLVWLRDPETMTAVSGWQRTKAFGKRKKTAEDSGGRAWAASTVASKRPWDPSRATIALFLGIWQGCVTGG